MAFSRHIDRQHHFVYSRCDGIVDDNDLRVHVLGFQVDTKGLPFIRELLDFRHLQKAEKLTLQGVIEISRLERQRSTDRDFRLAIVADRPLFYQMARVYAQILRTKNLKVRVFKDTTVAAGLTWLGYRNDDHAHLSDFIDRYAGHPL